MLNRSDRKSIKEESGLTHTKVIQVHRDSHGYPDRLIEARDNSGERWRGWWREGESAADIRWNAENVDGWPKSLS